MQYLVVSFSHKHTPLSLREKLSLDEHLTKSLCEELLACDAINEIIVLSTCNRVELIMINNDSYNAMQACFKELSRAREIPKDELENSARIFEGYSALQHIFLVASSLDSLVVGETQISGQLKKAYRYALHSGYCSNRGLGNVIDFAFKCASNVRNETGISQKPISIASVAVSNAKNLPIGTQNALVIGLGEMAQIATKNLLNLGYKVTLLNRNLSKAQSFKDSLNSENLSIADFGNLARYVNEFELIFTATAASAPIITREIFQKRDFKRYIFDLALPRDTEENLGENVEIILIDDLRVIVDENIQSREENLASAHKIVRENVDSFFHYMSILQVEPIIKTLRQFAKESAFSEISKAIHKGFLPEIYRQNVEKIIHNVFNIFLHTPTKNIKAISSSAQIDEIERTLKMLFSLSDENLREATHKHDKTADSMKFK